MSPEECTAAEELKKSVEQTLTEANVRVGVVIAKVAQIGQEATSDGVVFGANATL